MGSSFLTLSRVEKRFGDFWAVRSLDLAIDKGEFVAIMGPSGCGKTTTLRLIAGLERPGAGEIRLRDKVINDLKPWERDTPLVWQSLALFPFLNVRKNVEFGLKTRGVPAATRRRRALKWLERLGIAEFAERDVMQLSGGQRQRVALARALVTEPEILLLDEPLSALDAHLVVRMQAELTRLHRELGITFIYVTHSQSEAFAMAGRVVIMNKGEVEQIGPAKQVYRQPANRFVAEFVGTNNILHGRIESLQQDTVTVHTPAGTFLATASADHRLAPGDPVDYVISADSISIAGPDSVADNLIDTTVVSEQFIGSVVTIHVETATGQALRIQARQHEIALIDIDPGQPLRLSWSASSVYLLPSR
jgi:spermidine/putrescine transport system ATP-binding protein